MAVPAEAPVTRPVEELIAAIVALLLLQLPLPVSLKVIVEAPIHIGVLLLIGPGKGVTNNDVVIEQPVLPVV